MVKLSEYLEGMRSARDAAELEAAIQVPYKHSFRGRTWSEICKVRIEAGDRIVADHPHKFYIPHFGERRLLTCCGETCKVGRGYNSTGVRYVWHNAGEWAQARLRENGFGIRAAHQLWESGWNDYPHRCIGLVEKILAGEVADPQLNVLIGHKGHSPIKYTLEANDVDKHDRRAHRPCSCGGTLFDWGGSFSTGFYFVNWHCNGCSDVFTEYMTRSQFYDLRRGAPVTQETIDKAEANIREDYRSGKISAEQFRKEMLIVARARQLAHPRKQEGKP